jgi:hypothetical protein
MHSRTCCVNTYEVDMMQHTKMRHATMEEKLAKALRPPVLSAALKEGVPQRRHVAHAAVLSTRLAQHVVVPCSQPVTARRLLLARVAVQNVVVTLQQNAT